MRGSILTPEKLGKLVPFLLIDGVVFLAAFLLLYLDWIVHNTLYNYGLEFSSDWAIGYWTVLRIILGLLAFSIAASTIVGIVSYKKAKEDTKKTVFVCKSCGHALTELKGSFSIKDTLPKFEVLEKCPLCNQKLLDELLVSNSAG